MKKSIIIGLMFIFIFCIMLNSVKAEMLVSDAGVEYESEVVNQLKNISEVSVIVKIYSENKTIIDSILSDLSISEFKLKRKNLAGNGFAGNITQEGLEKLVDNPNIRTIYLDRISYTVTDKDESSNETKQTDEEIKVKESNLLITISILIIIYLIIRKIFYKKR